MGLGASCPPKVSSSLSSTCSGGRSPPPQVCLLLALGLPVSMPSPPSALLCPHVPTDSLPGLQGDDNEDGPPVHAPHTAAVAHEVVQDGGEFRPHLQAGEAGRAAGSACRLQPMEGHSWARRHPGSTCPALGRRGTVVWGRRFLLCGPLPSTLHPPSIHSWGTLSATHHAGLGRPTGCVVCLPQPPPRPGWGSSPGTGCGHMLRSLWAQLGFACHGLP